MNKEQLTKDIYKYFDERLKVIRDKESKLRDDLEGRHSQDLSSEDKQIKSDLLQREIIRESELGRAYEMVEFLVDKNNGNADKWNETKLKGAKDE